MSLRYSQLSLNFKHYYGHIRHTSVSFALRCFTCSDFKPCNKSCRLNAVCRIDLLIKKLESTLVVEARQPHLLTESIHLL